LLRFVSIKHQPFGQLFGDQDEWEKRNKTLHIMDNKIHT
jgi:hypothetical protein